MYEITVSKNHDGMQEWCCDIPIFWYIAVLLCITWLYKSTISEAPLYCCVEHFTFYCVCVTQLDGGYICNL